MWKAWGGALLLVATCAAVVPHIACAQDLGDYTIGVYVSAGAEPTCISAAMGMFYSMGFSTRQVSVNDVNAGVIADLAAIYFPGGSSPPYLQNITPEAKAGMLAAIEQGKAFIGTCAGAMFAAEAQVWEGTRYTIGQLGAFRGDAVGPAPGICDGVGGICVTYLRANAEHPVAQGVTTFRVKYYNSPTFVPDPEAETHVLATYERTGEPAIVAQRRGAGWVLLTGPHPEWEGGVTWTFMRNAMLWIFGLLDTDAVPSDG